MLHIKYLYSSLLDTTIHLLNIDYAHQTNQSPQILLPLYVMDLLR